MEGKQKFNYDSAENTNKENKTDPQEVISKILQIILGVIMAILHM
ncbi:FlhB HrpN YscU SpaS family protein [Chryseobacterium sp. IT-36CA2]